MDIGDWLAWPALVLRLPCAGDLDGPGVKPGRIARRVETVDVAPTIAAYLGVKYPSGTRGKVMTEIID